MTEQPFPVQNSTTSFWRADLHSLDSHRSTESLPAEADIVIIGAGYAGASVAHHLLENKNFVEKKQSVVILEAREACSGATGRNGGHLNADPYSRGNKALDLIGKEGADEVTLFEIRHLKEIQDLIKRDNIDCDYVLTRVTDVYLYENGAKNVKAKIDRLSKANVAGIDDVFYSDERNAERISGIKGAKGCTTHTAAHLYPYKLVMHLLAKAVASGINLQTFTPVHSVAPGGSDGKWTVNTPRGSIETSTVVYATNGYTNALLSELKTKVVPVRGICSRILCPKPHPPILSTSSILQFSEAEYDYLIQRTDGSIVVGGARTDYFSQLDTWFDVYDDSKLIEPAKQYFENYMQRNFLGWEDSEAYVDKVWTGIMGYSDDGFPYVGNVPQKPGQYIVAGFSGHGMPQVFLSAKAIASMIADGTKLEDADLPKLYQSTQERFDSKAEHMSLTNFKAFKDKLGLKN